MQPRTTTPKPSLHSRVFRLPSSRLGWTAFATMVGSIVLVFVLAFTSEPGPDDPPAWQQVAFVATLLCLLGSYVLGLVAVIRRGERSWMVLLPTVLLSATVVNELVQLVVQLASG